MQGTIVADVFKVGYCIKCDYEVFTDIRASKATAEQRSSFLNTCIPKALDPDGAIKPNFRCNWVDQKRTDAVLAAF